VATPQSQAAVFLNMLPFFIVFAVFTGGIGVTIDATAGERERQTLEPLVTNPVPRWQLVGGKLLASLVFTVVSIVECLLAFGLLLTQASVGDLNLNLQVAPSTLWGVFWLTAPLIPLALGVQFIIASFTRSFKEAQTYLSILPLLPSLPGMFLAFVPLRPALWHMLVPTFGQQLLINQLMRGEPVNPVFVASAAAAALAAGAVLLLVSARLYEGEHVLFAR
jgi:sodium transport system permease protein